MHYLMAANYDDDKGIFHAALRLNEGVLRLSYDADAAPQFRLVVSDSQDEVLQCDIEEYAMRTYGGTWESWRLRAPIGVLECHVIWSSAKGEPSPLQQILGCAEPVVVSSGVIFVVRVLSLQPAPAEQPISLQREAVPAGDWGVVRAYLQAHGEATYRELLDALSAAGQRMTEGALQARIKRWERKGRVVVERRGFPQTAFVKLAEARDRLREQKPVAARDEAQDFLPHYSDEILSVAGLTRWLLRRVYDAVPRNGRISTREIARRVGLVKQSSRLGRALSILVQERMIYYVGNLFYTKQPTNYRPAPDDVICRVLDAVIANPGATSDDLAKVISDNSSRLTYIARYLAAEGLIRREPVIERIGVGARLVWRHYPAQ